MSDAEKNVADVLIEWCVTELEEVAAELSCSKPVPSSILQQSPHNYKDNTFETGRVKILGKFRIF